MLSLYENNSYQYIFQNSFQNVGLHMNRSSEYLIIYKIIIYRVKYQVDITHSDTQWLLKPHITIYKKAYSYSISISYTFTINLNFININQWEIFQQFVILTQPNNDVIAGSYYQLIWLNVVIQHTEYVLYVAGNYVSLSLYRILKVL